MAAKAAHPAGIVQIVGGQLATAQQVAQVEGIAHVPADAAPCAWLVAHTKLLALQQRGVEEGQGEQDGPAGAGTKSQAEGECAWLFLGQLAPLHGKQHVPVLCLLGTALHNVLVEIAIGTQQVGLQALRRLVGKED